MPEITELLLAARDDPDKLGAVFQAVYPELKRLAAWRTAGSPEGSSATTTFLVHETYLKLIRSRDLDIRDRHHFFACAAKAMRQILVDHARAENADKRGGGGEPVALPEELSGPQPAADWIDLDRALEALDEIDHQQRELVELRYFAGLSREEVAELLGCSVRTVERNWQRARAFLYAQLEARGA